MLKRVLIANRGEIALRAIRACREMGIETVSIYSTADKEALHTLFADHSICVGPPLAKLSYLNKSAVLTAALATGCEAIFPGYGFLSENAEFVSMVEEHGLVWIGPSAEHIRLMGDKISARRVADEIGLPTVPGSTGSVDTVEEAKKLASEFGYPVIIKATAGGGGKGMQAVFSEKEVELAYQTARSEAGAAFGNDKVYMEKYLQKPRHIEVQVLCDTHGAFLHLGERDCSLQRRHQKVLEEATGPSIQPEEREKIGTIVANAMKKLQYRGVGTVEFLFEDGEFYFIEMNTRLQVEHPITEMVTGIDLVQSMLKIASGLPLGISQKDIVFRGHAIECRINAEDPETFMPSPGRIEAYCLPGGMGVRMDTAFYNGYRIPAFYDSMIGKLIIYGRDRPDALARLNRALSEFFIEGIKTTIPLHRKIIEQPEFIAGTYDIHWLEKMLGLK